MRRYRWSDGRGPKWGITLLAVVCIAVVVFVVAAFTAGGDKDPTPGKKVLSTPTSFAALLDSSAVRQSIGSIVFLNDVQLKPGPTDSIFFARDTNGRELVVHFNNALAKIPEAGTLADVTGIVVPLPSAASLRKQWKLEKEKAERVRDDVVYIEAERVKPKPRTQSSSRQNDES